MYTKEQLESIKKVEATREERLKQILAGNHPRRMTAEEKDAYFAKYVNGELKVYLADNITVTVTPDGATAPPAYMTEIPEFDISSMDMTGMDLSQLTDEQLAYFSSMSEEERSERGYELGELKVISQYPRRAEFVPTFIDSYKKRLAESRNYYDKRPLNWTHWTSSTVK